MNSPRIWIGNYDGRRRGLVIAKSKTAAAKIVGCSIRAFNNYWTNPQRVLQINGLGEFEPDTLYTCDINSREPATWFKGRCPL